MAEKEKKDKKKHGKKGKTKEMHVRKADSGGYIARHDMEQDPGSMQPTPEQTHVLPDMDALKDHMQEHLGEEEEPAPAPQG